MFPYEHFMVLLASVDDGSEMSVNIIQMSGCFFLQIEELFTDCLSRKDMRRSHPLPFDDLR
ncbi:MAG: hypothetical protein ACLVLH_12765 [Eisenbergiella massiliensis]